MSLKLRNKILQATYRKPKYSTWKMVSFECTFISECYYSANNPAFLALSTSLKNVGASNKCKWSVSKKILKAKDKKVKTQ